MRTGGRLGSAAALCALVILGSEPAAAQLCAPSTGAEWRVHGLGGVGSAAGGARSGPRVAGVGVERRQGPLAARATYRFRSHASAGTSAFHGVGAGAGISLKRWSAGALCVHGEVVAEQASGPGPDDRFRAINVPLGITAVMDWRGLEWSAGVLSNLSASDAELFSFAYTERAVGWGVEGAVAAARGRVWGRVTARWMGADLPTGPHALSGSSVELALGVR